MSSLSQILVSASRRGLVPLAFVAALAAGCGQKGPLFLTTGDAATGRATVIETLSPGSRRPAAAPQPPASAPPMGTASPVRQP